MVSITDNDLLLSKIRFYRIYPSYFYVDSLYECLQEMSGLTDGMNRIWDYLNLSLKSLLFRSIFLYLQKELCETFIEVENLAMKKTDFANKPIAMISKIFEGDWSLG